MTTPQYELEGRIAEVLAATAIVAVAGLLLWPPEAVYWTAVADAVGEAPALTALVALAVGIGAWVQRTAGFGLAHVAVGALLAYGLGMAGIELVLAPTSPAHLVLYGVIAGCLVAGCTLWWAVERVRGRR